MVRITESRKMKQGRQKDAVDPVVKYINCEVSRNEGRCPE